MYRNIHNYVPIWKWVGGCRGDQEGQGGSWSWERGVDYLHAANLISNYRLDVMPCKIQWAAICGGCLAEKTGTSWHLSNVNTREGKKGGNAGEGVK